MTPLRLAVLLCAAAAAFALWRAGDAPVSALDTPKLRPPPGIFEKEEREASLALAEFRVGSFERPESVPAYEVLEETSSEDGSARSAHLVVDTRSRGREDFTLITRDLKARFAGYDVVSVEFTDTAEVLDYHGGAIIVNTALGARSAGYFYAPPNTGYYVQIAN